MENNAQEARRGRPCEIAVSREPICHKSALDTIRQLEKDGQPWMIGHFPLRAKFVEDEITYCYELLFFQTLDREEPYDMFMMDRDTFREIVEKYRLTLRYKSKLNGEIYSYDNRLRDIARAYRKERAILKSDIRDVRREQYRLTDKAHGEQNDDLRRKLKKERDEKRLLAENLEDKFYGLQEEYCKKYSLKIYQI